MAHEEKFAVKIHPTVWFLVVPNLILFAALYYSSGQNVVLWFLATAGLLYSVGALNNVLNLEERLNYEDDQKIEEQVRKASEEYWKRLKSLQTAKKKLPRIDTWEIATIQNWEKYLIEEAEQFWGLLNEVTHCDSRDVPTDYYLAHSLAEFAHLKNDLATKETEWAVKRIEVLGLTRQRQISFKPIVDGERELRWMDNELAGMEQRLQTLRHQIVEAVKRARASNVEN
jgi:hypothetical protein